MIVELLTLLVMLTGGAAVLHLLGMRGWGLSVLGFATGVALYLGIGLIQVLTGLPTSPVLTLMVVGGVPAAAWVVVAIRDPSIRPRVRTGVLWAGAALAATGVLALLARWANLVSWSPDSFRYLLSGSLIAQGQYGTASAILVEKRVLGVPLLHSAGNLDGEWYLPAITPMIAIAVLGAVAWFAWTAMRDSVPRRLLIPAILLGVMMLASVNRFVFHAFYVNGNMLFGMLLLLIVGASWLLLRGDRDDRRALQAMVLIAIPALVVTRAEASLVIGLAVLPILFSASTGFRFKAAVLAVLGAATVAWELRVIAAYLGEGLAPPFSAIALLALGVVMAAAIPVLRWRWLLGHSQAVLWGVLGILWLALAALAVRDRDVLIDSVRATVQNLIRGAGSWGLSAVLIGSLTVIAIAVFSYAGDRQLSFVLTAFVPLAFLLAYFRGIAFRVGDGDSLNRIVIEFFPVAVLLIVAAVGEGRARWPRARARAARQLPSSE
jgi:hypothetical protein